jgi:hypothetical protein
MESYYKHSQHGLGNKLIIEDENFVGRHGVFHHEWRSSGLIAEVILL